MLTGWESSIGSLAMLGFGLALGLKHATEVDHVVAVSTIVSEHRNLLRSAIVGALWGIGHTASILAVGIVVLGMRIAIPAGIAGWLELAVALMIIGLGASALMRALRRRRDFHLHRHSHDGVTHIHIHYHDPKTEHTGAMAEHSHAVSLVGVKPILVGAMHGLAGSAALTLLVLSQVESVALGLLYLAVFGAGSIIGMLLMSVLVALPFFLTARRFAGIHDALQTFAGAISIAFGIWYAFQTNSANGFLRIL